MIGWYVHHVGRGHLHRARAICRALDEDVTILSSLAPEPWATWVELPRDDQEGSTAATAHGVLHWAPVDSQGHRERLATIAGWAARTRPRLVVVDVSVEVTVLLRTLGVPVVVMGMPGVREDLPHDLGYALADLVLAPWPGEVYRPDHLRARTLPTTYAGGISQHAHRPAPSAAEIAAARPRGEGRHVLLVSGGGGSEITADDLAAARAATPGWTWTAAGVLGEWHDDLWALLHAVDVVVIAAGQNSVADVAAAGTRAVVIPEERPFGEQRATAAALRAAGLAVVRDRWPTDWAATLDEAMSLTPRWERWGTVGAPARAARAIEAVVPR